MFFSLLSELFEDPPFALSEDSLVLEVPFGLSLFSDVFDLPPFALSDDSLVLEVPPFALSFLDAPEELELDFSPPPLPGKHVIFLLLSDSHRCRLAIDI